MRSAECLMHGMKADDVDNELRKEVKGRRRKGQLRPSRKVKSNELN